MTVNQTDPYVVLDVARGATQQQIRHAYRSQMRTSHPDRRTPNEPAADPTVQQVVDAYAMLADPARRAEYDQRTTLSRRPDPIRVRVTLHRRPGPPPIQASPVRWHQTDDTGSSP